jgi:hypothetical protein
MKKKSASFELRKVIFERLNAVGITLYTTAPNEPIYPIAQLESVSFVDSSDKTEFNDIAEVEIQILDRFNIGTATWNNIDTLAETIIGEIVDRGNYLSLTGWKVVTSKLASDFATKFSNEGYIYLIRTLRFEFFVENLI